MKRISLSTLSFFFMAILITNIACHKKRGDVTTPPVTSYKKIARIGWSINFGGPLNFTYDSSGRLIKVADATGEVTYQYGQGTVEVKEVSYPYYVTVNDVTGTLDNKGRMVSGTNVTVNSAYPEQWNFTYDANGYLSRFTNKNVSINQTFDYTYANNDATAISLMDGNTLQGTETFTFYTDKKSLSGIDKFVVGFLYNDGLFGKVNAHLMKSDIAGTTMSRLYDYTTDNDGYVKTVTLSGSYSGTADYTYQ